MHVLYNESLNETYTRFFDCFYQQRIFFSLIFILFLINLIAFINIYILSRFIKYVLFNSTKSLFCALIKMR